MLRERNKSGKLFPQAYISLNTITIQRPKKRQLFVWLILVMIVLCAILFGWFQADLIDKAASLSEVIR